mgnify:CR=1 FL=1
MTGLSALIDNSRTLLLAKNIVVSFFIKGWSAAVVLLMVPLTLKCLGIYQNGVWLTISSMLVWIDQMDIGLGNGLRNKLAVSVAQGDMKGARQVVSSTFALLCLLIIPVLMILLLLIWKCDIYSFLNVEEQIIPELRVALTSAVTLVCGTFVFKFIGNVYMGMQLPAATNLINAVGQTVALAATWLLFVADRADFLSVVTVNAAAPMAVYMLAYPYTFHWKYPELKPAIACVNIHTALGLANLGVKFFWIQIASVVQFMTANILISKFFTPQMVTPYQVAYRYMNLVMVLFTVVCMPFWNATTDAYTRNDMRWIAWADRKMTQLSLLILLALLLMTLMSPWVYRVWIGDADLVPFGMTCMVAAYIFLLILSMRYSYFLNGIGAMQLQLYMTVSAVIFIPLAWVACRYTNDIMWFLAVMCFCNLPGLIVNVIQFNKILKGKAKGIWRIR